MSATGVRTTRALSRMSKVGLRVPVGAGWPRITMITAQMGSIIAA
jgi:hypothetical protein